MQASTLRGFVVGLISGFTLYHVVSDSIVDRTADRVIQKITIEEVAKPNPITLHMPPAPTAPLPEPEPERNLRYYVQERKLNKAELYCLAKNIYHEAGVEDYDGKIAVGQVTFNRVDHKRWGTSVCKVVYQRKQFSWTNNSALRKQTPKGQLWEESKRAALDVVKGARLTGLETALFYHSTYIAVPKWADAKYKLVNLGLHIFYSEDLKIS